MSVTNISEHPDFVSAHDPDVLRLVKLHESGEFDTPPDPLDEFIATQEAVTKDGLQELGLDEQHEVPADWPELQRRLDGVQPITMEIPQVSVQPKAKPRPPLSTEEVCLQFEELTRQEKEMHNLQGRGATGFSKRTFASRKNRKRLLELQDDADTRRARLAALGNLLKEADKKRSKANVEDLGEMNATERDRHQQFHRLSIQRRGLKKELDELQGLRSLFGRRKRKRRIEFLQSNIDRMDTYLRANDPRWTN